MATTKAGPINPAMARNRPRGRGRAGVAATGPDMSMGEPPGVRQEAGCPPGLGRATGARTSGELLDRLLDQAQVGRAGGVQQWIRLRSRSLVAQRFRLHHIVELVNAVGSRPGRPAALGTGWA